MARRLSSLSSSEVTLPALTRLWVLRMLVPLGAWRSFYGPFGFQNDRLVEIMGMDVAAKSRTPKACHRFRVNQVR